MNNPFLLTVNRIKHHAGGIGGELIHKGKRICFTFERPYYPNTTEKSCIRNGYYLGFIRDRRNVTKENKEWRIQLNVPGRANIQFHRGTILSHSVGCILVGTSFTENGLSGDYSGWINLLNAVYNHFGTTDLKYFKNRIVHIRFQGLDIPESSL